MGSILLLLTAGGLAYFALSGKGASLVQQATEPPEYTQIRNKVKADWQFYLDAAPHGSPSDPQLVGDCFNPNPLGVSPVPTDTEKGYLENCLEWAAKCYRLNGKCCDLIPSCPDGNTPHNFEGANDNVIINKASDIALAVIAKRYATGTAEQQADLYIDTLMSINSQVRGFSFISLIPYLTLIVAPLTAGLSIAAAAGAASAAGLTGFSVIETAVLNTLATTIPAGLVTTNSIKAIAGTPQGVSDARMKAVQIFKVIKVIGV